MRNVVIRFCQQNKINKELYFFIHNNDFLNENSKYKNLFPDQNNKRIISIILKPDIPVKKNDPLISMESIISKINNPYIIKTSYKQFYCDEEQLSDDGYYKIHKARNKKTSEKYAIKIFDFNEIISDYKADKMDDPRQKDMEAFIHGLIEQIKIMSILMVDNINTVQLYQCYLTKDDFGIVMELCDTDLMHIFCSTPSGFSLEQVNNILTQLNNTFRIMAKNNIIHGDLKLDNILVKYKNADKNSFTLKLTDYGVSNKYILDITAKFGAKNAICNNMSPEMLRSEDNYSQECDLWSLGILIHLLLTKKYPYPGNSTNEILNNIYKNGMRSIQKTGNLELDHLI
jgi:serine/threonine protein kinase